MPERPVLDYDETTIPAAYDRARDHGPGVLALWMGTVEETTRGRRRIRTVLDLGCGTGRFSPGLAETFQARVLGIDPSRRMLARARTKRGSPRVRYARARGEEMPLRDGAVDLVFQSMVFHHFARPEGVARECRRVLGEGGVVFLRGGTADRIDSYPYVPFFPTSLPLLRETLPTCARVREVFEGAGFRTIAQGLLTQEVAATHAVYADKIEAGGDSVLSRLARADFQRGVARLRAHARRVDPQRVTEPIDYFGFG